MVLGWDRQHNLLLWSRLPRTLWLWLMLGLVLLPTLVWGLDLLHTKLQYLDPRLSSRWSCEPFPMPDFVTQPTGCSTEQPVVLLTRRLSLPVHWPAVSSRSQTATLLPQLLQPVLLELSPRPFVEAYISSSTEAVRSELVTASSVDWHTDLRQLLRRPAAIKARVRRPLPERDEINELLDMVLPHFDVDPTLIPSALRRNVSQRIHTYVSFYRKMVQAQLLRADRYLPMIKQVFLEWGVPTYYAYLPLIESAFRPDVQHPVSGARGLWQFMGATAQICGLEVSKKRDERLNPERSTKAAARYINVLRKRFGADFPLHVLAAYNFGETNLARVMQRAQSDDIWTLYLRRLIPPETREYLLRMIAMWVVVAEPGRFHLLLAETANLPLLERPYGSSDKEWLQMTQFARHPGE